MLDRVSQRLALVLDSDVVLAVRTRGGLGASDDLSRYAEGLALGDD